MQYLPADDEGYAAWAETHCTVRAASEASLVKYLNMSYPEGAPTRIFAPSQIIAALKAIDPAKAAAVLSGADAMTVLEFQTATGIRMDDARLNAALSAVGLTPQELQAAILAI